MNVFEKYIENIINSKKEDCPQFTTMNILGIWILRGSAFSLLLCQYTLNSKSLSNKKPIEPLNKKLWYIHSLINYYIYFKNIRNYE